MNQAAISRGKDIIKDAIRLANPGEVARIPVADEANLAVFQQALRAYDIQRMLLQKNVTVEFYIPQAAVDQAKKHMLQVIRTASNEVEEIVFPYLPQDYADAEIALASTEVQRALRSRGITASLQRVAQTGEIIVASIDQVTYGELDSYLRNLDNQ
ncbi:hypothetical protein [Calothrix sp. NIES-2098]|uniref:hypothetical protein n=1 Tax=Calothrix sp. NIES-2098 TaxID=1954171 RepID=UPI000B61011D|nr:hypothetical protein NIES2098_17640 [Calothrix sp. NIES-2098]